MTTDWRRIEQEARNKEKQLSGNFASRGLFGAVIESCSTNQTAKLIYNGGERSIPIPMPFESTSSWIRSIPDVGSTAICGYRADTEDLVFLTYELSTAQKKIAAYDVGANLYRPLLPGEHEIHSSGLAQSFYSSRPVLEQRGGVVRSWLDQDRLESGAKAPLHTRQIWEHASNSMGDEERFGVVRRPMNFLLKNPATAILALSPTSYLFHDYPYPDFSLPGGVPAVFNVTAAAAAVATEAALELVGEFKQRPFAKEYLKIINNPLFPAPPNAKLIDFREGQVFNDEGFQVFGPHGAYLRARYEYYTPTLDATTFTVDEIGNVDWLLSVGAISGWGVTIPTGGANFTVAQSTNFFSGLNFSSLSLLSTSIQAVTNVTVESLLNTDMTAGVNFSQTVGVQHDTTVGTNTTLLTGLNYELTAGVNYKMTAGVQADIFAPFVNIGASPVTPAVLGTEMSTWLADLLSTMISVAPSFTTGNLGAGTPLNAVLLAKLNQLLAQIPTLTSKTILVSP